MLVNSMHQHPKILHGAIAGVDSAVIAIGIRAAQAAFFVFLPDRVDRHQPDDVSAESFDPVKVGYNGQKRTLLSMTAYVDAVYHCIAEGNIGIGCHKQTPLFLSQYDF